MDSTGFLCGRFRHLLEKAAVRLLTTGRTEEATAS
jgi:hypothetical protein